MAADVSITKSGSLTGYVLLSCKGNLAAKEGLTEYQPDFWYYSATTSAAVNSEHRSGLKA